MHDATVVGVSNHFGNLPHQFQTIGGTELVLELLQVVVKADGLRIVFEQDGDAGFVFGQSASFEDPGMLERFEQSIFAHSGSADGFAFIGPGFGTDPVQADATDRIRYRNM